MKLDDKDVKIIRALQKNAREPLKKLSRKTRISISTLHDRIKRLEKEGVIEGYRLELDPDKVGKSLTAMVLVSMKYFHPEEKGALSQDQVAKKIAGFPEVQEVFIMAGDWDIWIKAKCGTNLELADFVTKKLRRMKGVDKTITYNVMYRIKDTSVVEV